MASMLNDKDDWSLLSMALADTPDQLSFRAVRSIIDTWPQADSLVNAVQTAATGLDSWSIDACSIETGDSGGDLEYESTDVAIDSPSWPLVRSLTLADPASVVVKLARFGEARLSKISFRYGAADLLQQLDMSALQPLVTSVAIDRFPLTLSLQQFLNNLPSELAELRVGDIRSDEIWRSLLAWIKSPRCNRLRSLSIRYIDETSISALFNDPPPELKQIAPLPISALMHENSQLLRQITSIDMSGKRVFDGTDAIAPDGMIEVVNLKDINLSSCSLGPNEIGKLASYLQFKNLEHLNLSSNPIGDRGFAAVSSCLSDRLLHLNVHRCKITDLGIDASWSKESVTSVRELILSDNPIGDAGVKSLSAGMAHAVPCLNTVDFTGCGLGDNGVSHLVSSPFCEQLQVLRLSRNQISDRGALAIASAPYLTALKALTLENNEIGEPGIKGLAESAALVNLTGLSIGGAHLTDLDRNVVLRLVEANSFRRLRWFSIIGPGFRDEHAIAVSRANDGWQRLRELVVDQAALTDEGIAALARSPVLRHLWVLHITANSNPVGKNGILAIAESDVLSNLVELHLDNVECDDETLIQLSKSKAFRHLDRVRLGESTHVVLNSSPPKRQCLCRLGGIIC
jgi:Leucine-rich repeat (LRR) protein